MARGANADDSFNSTASTLNLFEWDAEFKPQANVPFIAGWQTERGNKGRGTDHLIKRLRAEMNRRARKVEQTGRYSPQISRGDVNHVTEFIDWIGQAMFADIGISISKAGGGASGLYNPANRMVALFERAIENGSVSATMIHELWHTLEQFITPKDMRAVRATYRRAVEAYIAKHPHVADFATRQADGGRNVDNRLIVDTAEIAAFKKRYPKAPEGVEYIGEHGPIRLRNTDESYRYTNQREFFAETMLDLYEDHISDDYSAPPGSVFARIVAFAAKVYRRIVEAIASRLDRREMQRIFKNFEDGRYDTGTRNLLDSIDDADFHRRDTLYSKRDDEGVTRRGVVKGLDVAGALVAMPLRSRWARSRLSRAGIRKAHPTRRPDGRPCS